jgi:hypothetical protein
LQERDHDYWLEMLNMNLRSFKLIFHLAELVYGKYGFLTFQERKIKTLSWVKASLVPLSGHVLSGEFARLYML